jgi:hypothetical protein
MSGAWFTQAALLQISGKGAVEQDPSPLQVVWQLVSEQEPCGSCPAGTLEQVPTSPGRLQALQPPQAVSQQTLSAQWPLVHWASKPQGEAPGSFGTQLVPLQ